MKNSLKHIGLFLFVLVMSAGSGYATNAAGTYTLQKGASGSTTLDPGKYVIVIKSTNLYAVPAFDGAGAKNIQCENYRIDSYVTGSYYQRAETCTLDLDGTEGITEWTITEDLGSYMFFDGTYYICGQSSTSNKLLASTSSSTAAKWTITHTGTTYTGCTVVNDDDVTYNHCRGNGTILSGYTSSGQNLYFFKKTATLYDIDLSDDYAAGGNASMDAKVNDVSVSKAAAGATVTLSQTANPNYCFDSWTVYDEDLNEVSVTNNTFTMPAKAVTVYPTYTSCGTDATVTAASSESISQTTATVRCSGGISSVGDACCVITEYGFVISAKSANTTPIIGGSGVTKHQIGTGYSTLNTTFSKALTGLTASTTYCVRAYATNGHGTAYSSAVHEFTTAADVVFGNYIITCSDYHTVTYNKNTTADITGSLPTDENEYSAGQTVYVSDGTIARTGYNFVGWNTDQDATEGITEFEMGASDMTIYAIWSPINYTLTMATSPAGASAAITAPRTGEGSVENKHYGEEITVTVSVPAHHSFSGWSSSNGGTFANASALSTTFTMPAGNTTVTATFTEDTKYTVTWSDNGETEEESVYTGETTVYPALEGCDIYVAAGWILDDGTFTAETATKPAATIYATGATTPAVSGNVTYKAVYRHKCYTTDDFVLNTTTAGAYYLSVNTGTVRYSGAKSSSKLSTVTDKLTAVPVYVEKEAEGQYSFKLVSVANEQYIVGSSSTDFGWQDTKTGDYKWNVTAGTQGKGDYHILNAGTNSTRGIIYNNSGNYIGNYAGNNVSSSGSSYYDMNFVPGYYYTYSPTKGCYDITVTTNNWSGGEFLTLDGSKKLSGNILTVKVACGKTISSWSFTSGTATLASGTDPEYMGMEGDKEVYRFTIIPTSNVTLGVNFGNGQTRNIRFLDGASVIEQTKTTAVTDKHDCDSYTLPAGYSTAGGSGGACPDWTFDGWTATPYTFGQMVAPEDIVAAGTSEDVHGDVTWYAVYHKTFAAGAYFKLKYGTKYVSGYSSNQFSTSETEADGLMFGLENDYLYYIDKTTHAKVWVYYSNSTGQNVTVNNSKPTSNTYKTTFTEDSGTYQVVCNSRYLEYNSSGDKVVFYATSSADRRPTRPDASGFTAYYPKTDCAIEYVNITYDAGEGNSCTPASAVVETNTTITLPVEADITYDNTDWTFAGWSASAVQSIASAAPADLIPGGGSYTVTGSVTLHAVYTQTPPDGTFDNTKGGRFIIWAEDGGMNYYAKSNGQTKGKLDVALACSEAAVFEFVETGTAGQYKIHIVGEEKFMKGEGCADAQTDFEYTFAGSAPVWTVTATATEGVWKVVNNDCGNRGFVFAASGIHKFGHYASQNTQSEAYKDIHIGQCDDYYTTNPNKTLSVTGNVKVTSTNGRMVMAKDQLVVNASNIGAGAPVIITSGNSDVYFSTTREVNISKASKPTTSVSINADGDGNITNRTIYVHYMPTVATDGIENVQVVVSSSEKSAKIPVKVRHLPATFAIAAKVGTNWYALTGNMSGAKTPKAIQIEVDESTWTAYAPDTCAFQLWPVKTTASSGDRYQEQGEKVRFSAVNNATIADAGLWANNSSSSNTINNSAAITAISSDPADAYEWRIAAAEAGSTWKYSLQTDQSQNTNKLNLHRATDLVWGTYTDGQAVTSEIYLLPISEITPFDFQVVEWYPTKVLLQTNAALSSPAVRVNGEEVASPVLTNKGGKLWEISGLPLESNPASLMSITYTAADVTYKGIKSVPIIISRSTQNVTAAPFTTLTKEVYNYADLVVRDGAVLTMDGTDAANRFYDVTIYPTSKVSVPEGKKLGVHSLTFFGGIDEIYDGSAYTINKYGVPELSLKGQFGTKTIATIDYVMRVNLDQMYQIAVPYDVNLTDITYWDGTAMTPGTDLYVSAYDGQARANRESKTWVWEEDFESKFGEAKLKAGIGYTISAEPQSGIGSEYSIIRMPMKSNVAANATEGEKTVHVTAYVNTNGVAITDNHKGWNYLSNPYMVSVSGADADSKLVVGCLKETGAGPWEWVLDDVRYVTIPFDNGTDYYQRRFSTATLKPFKSFFLQIGTTGELSFALASRQSMPARYLQAEEREVEFEVLFSNNTRTDNTGLLIAEKYTSAYEVNADLEKMVGSMSVYTIYGGYSLAYNALSQTEAEQMIPIGYVAPEAGDYTFALDENSDYGQIEHIYLTDHEQSLTIDLLDGEYAFKTAAGKNESRFAFNVVLKNEAPEITTGTDVVGGEDGQPLKFIYRGKMYIMNNGVVYDATGKRVKETNK